MDKNHDGMIGGLPVNNNKEIPTANSDAKSITALIKHSGDVVGYQLSDGAKVTKEEAINIAKAGGISGVAISTRNGEEYLRSLPDQSEGNNLSSLPSIKE